MRGPFFCLFLLLGAAVAAPVTIPFRMSRGMIVVEATIPGADRSLQFIVDSGAGDTVVAQRTAEALGLAMTGKENIRTVRGAETAGRGAVTDLRLGAAQGMKFSTRPLVVDLRREARLMGGPLDGLIGMDFFEGRSVQIDFKASCLRVSPGGKPGATATRLPLSRSEDGMFVHLKAADARLPRVRVDTGCARSLCWSPPAGAVRGLWSDGKTLKTTVHFGALAVSEIPTDLYRRPLFPGEDGLLGTALLSRFDSVWIDSVNGQIAFEGGGDGFRAWSPAR